MLDCLRKELVKGDMILYHVTDGYWATTYFGVITGEMTKRGKARFITDGGGKSFGQSHQLIKVNEELIRLHNGDKSEKLIEQSRLMKEEL